MSVYVVPAVSFHDLRPTIKELAVVRVSRRLVEHTWQAVFAKAVLRRSRLAQLIVLFETPPSVIPLAVLGLDEPVFHIVRLLEAVWAGGPLAVLNHVFLNLAR